MSDSVGSVSVDVVPDASGWAEKLRAQIRDQTVKVRVEAETTEAETKLDELIAKEDDAARTRHGKVDINTDKVGSAATKLDGFLGKLGLIPALAIAAGSALIPLTATVGALGLALAAPIAIGVGGVGLFAVLGGLAAKDTEAKLKAIDKLRQHLGTLTKGTTAYAQAQQQLKDAQAALTPEQQKFAAAQDSLTGAFQKFLQGPGGKSLLDVMAQGMTVLAHVLPQVAPVIVAVGGALSTLLGDVAKAAGSRGFEHFIGQFSRLVGPDIVAGGHILGNLAVGLGSLLLAAGKSGFSHGLVSGIESLTSNFAKWASSKSARHDVQALFEYAQKNGPGIASTIGSIARAVGHFVQALAPLGPPVLRVVQGIADALSHIPVPVLTALAGAFVAAVAFQKVGGFKGVGLLSKGIGAVTGSKGIAGDLLGGGVQKVFVVNMPGELGGGPSGGPGGVLKRALPGGVTVGAVAAGVGGALTAAGIAAAVIYALHQESKPGPGALAGGMTPAQWAAFNRNRLNAPTGLGPGTIPDPVHLRATSTALDAIRSAGARASRQLDLIGPAGQQGAGQAIGAIKSLQDKLNAIRDKKFTIIAQDAAAIASLERIQAMQIADKSFNVYQHNQIIERVVGPGGGMGQNPHGSAPGGSAGGGASAGRTPVHVHLDGSGRATLSGFIEGGAQRVYDANGAYNRAVGGQ